MADTPRKRFEREMARITGDDAAFPTDFDGIADDAVREAIEAFIPAADPERSRPMLPKPRSDGSIEHVTVSNRTAENYLRVLRLAHERGLDLLGATAADVNAFVHDLVDGRLPDHEGSVSKPVAKIWQGNLRVFYRFCTEPGRSDDRPSVGVEWPADDITMFTERSTPRHDEADRFDAEELDALREATVKTQNPRRDRAFLELLAGTCQRLYALVTLRVRDVFPDPDDGVPYVLLNPEIRNDGDKGAIEKAGRWRPIVSDPRPVREWITNHPLRDTDVRAEHGVDAGFEDCYLFIGSITHRNTVASDHWAANAADAMLKRLRDRTAAIPGVPTVTKPVNAHNFRHWAYTKSKALPLDEDDRRKVFGWGPGSDTGEETYGHTTTEEAGRRFAEEWAEQFGAAEESVAGVAEQLAGTALGANLSPEARRALARQFISDDEFIDDVAAAIARSGE